MGGCKMLKKLKYMLNSEEFYNSKAGAVLAVITMLAMMFLFFFAPIMFLGW